jgi:DNA-binding MarR family transcriptional regulator
MEAAFYSLEQAESLDNVPGFLVLQLSSLWQDKHKKALEKYHSITHTQFAILASIHWLSMHDSKKLTQIGLSRHIKMDPMTISQTIKGLEKKELVTRITHPLDVRAKMIHLTPAGEKLIKEAENTIMQVEHRFFEVLGKDLPEFNRYMRTIIAANE